MSRASPPALDERPALRRLFSWGEHRAFLALLAIAAPLTIAFCWHEGLASLGDDSASYLTLARYLSPFADPALVAPWAKYHSHFPPLFPLLLAWTGAAQNVLAAHLVVAACAVIALPFVYRYASLRLGGAGAGVLVTLLFLLSPNAWISILGILTEPLYLTFSLVALIFHDRRLAKDGRKDALIAFGLLLAAAYLTRAAGIALVVAYAAHVTVGAIARRKVPAPSALIPFVPVAALAGLWLALRPDPGWDSYHLTLQGLLDRWRTEPAMLGASWHSLFGAWLASFTGESAVSLSMRLSFGALGFAGVCGAVLAAKRNRLDGWYVLASLAMLFVWAFPEDTMRRLVYPLLPVLLVQAGEALVAVWSRLSWKGERRALFAGWVLLVAMTIPASVLVLQKALDRKPVFAGSAYSLSSITDYYTTINVAFARALAAQNAAVLEGLESIERATPPGSRVMWSRPEYVALLGKRPAAAWYFAWDRPALAREIHRSGTAYLVVARLYKSDLAGREVDAFTPLVKEPPAYLHPTLIVANPATREMEFALLAVDRAALDLYLAKVGPR